MEKSSVNDIRARFDNDVERFASLETGQQSFVDAREVLDRTTRAAAATSPSATHLLDVGCGAGNYTLKFLEHGPEVHVDLVDLSQPMLNRAVERVGATTSGTVQSMQADIRECALESERYDVILAAAVLHHLRTDAEWEAVAAKFYDALRPSGALWVADLVDHDAPPIRDVMWDEYGTYLESLDGPSYREEVFGYIEQEDTPRPLLEQIDIFREAGFQTAEILHKNTTFAAFGVMK
ncbi:class I SAM-dependent methyltransferase [Salinibacter sp. 10B]|uniref:class I SAM-dependent methyltransferase n=1 Tax=Salinibacter sp. 10B TaxID=1923971 RepID=UPI000CF474FD|nr:class I SAM-dependent methyltransferase [Salinibacter sp. 10B]